MGKHSNEDEDEDEDAETNCDTLDKITLYNCAYLFSNSKDYENLSHA